MDSKQSNHPPGVVTFFANQISALCMLHWFTHQRLSYFTLPNLMASKHESLCSAIDYKWTTILRLLNVCFPICISVEKLQVHVIPPVVNYGNYCWNVCGNHIIIVVFCNTNWNGSVGFDSISLNSSNFLCTFTDIIPKAKFPAKTRWWSKVDI